MRRFRELKHGRMVQFARDMVAAANAIREARKKAGWEAWERNVRRKEPDPEVEAEATKKPAEGEESIARKYDMCPGFSFDEIRGRLGAHAARTTALTGAKKQKIGRRRQAAPQFVAHHLAERWLRAKRPSRDVAASRA
jgi:hypothetical protein